VAGGGHRVGSRVVAVRSAGGRAPGAASKLGGRRRSAATVVGRGVQMVLEAVVVRDQDVSSGRVGHCSAVAVVAAAAATAAAGCRRKQRRAVGRSARSKVRFQHHRR